MEQIIILTNLRRHDSVVQAKKKLYKMERLSFLQACEGMIALYKQRKHNIQGLLYSIYY